MTTTDAVPETLAGRLTWLFQHVTKQGGVEYTLQEVADGTAQLGHRVTVSAIWKIRNGVTQKPSYLTLQTLAQFFNVSAGFFYDPELTGTDLDEAELAAVMRDEGVKNIALRSSQLDEAGRKAILNMLNYMLENHDHDTEDSGAS